MPSLAPIEDSYTVPDYSYSGNDSGQSPTYDPSRDYSGDSLRSRDDILNYALGNKCSSNTSLHTMDDETLSDRDDSDSGHEDHSNDDADSKGSSTKKDSSGDSCDRKAKRASKSLVQSSHLAILLGIFLFIFLFILFLPSVDRRLSHYVTDWRYRLFCKVLLFVLLFVLLVLLFNRSNKTHH